MKKLLSLYDTAPDRQAIMLFINWFRQLVANDSMSDADFAEIEEQYKTPVFCFLHRLKHTRAYGIL